MNITDICNIALNHIGKEMITSFNEESEAARTCKMHYDLQRKVLLRAYTWSFAAKTVRLPLLAECLPGLYYVYPYPPECVMARKIFNEETTEDVLEHNLKGNVDQILLNDNTKAIVSNYKNAFLQYTYDAKDANLFPADFSQALSYYLASAIAIPLTGSAALSQQMLQLGSNILAESKFTMMDERNRTPEYPCNYLKARW